MRAAVSVRPESRASATRGLLSTFRANTANLHGAGSRHSATCHSPLSSSVIRNRLSAPAHKASSESSGLEFLVVTHGLDEPFHAIGERRMNLMSAAGSCDVAATDLSIVIPTRNEAGNIRMLVERLRASLAEISFEIIFVDDSDDDTPAVVEAVRRDTEVRLALIHREGKSRVGGLGGAVVLGLRAANAPWVCVMDGDLQHPPEMVFNLFLRKRWDDLDLIVASRYSGGGESHGGLAVARRLVSRSLTDLARIAFAKPLRRISDPMSGFFLIRKSAIDLDDLHPHGFKILLEIIVRNPMLRTTEVGFTFGKRYAGDSKASALEAVRYLLLVAELKAGSDTARMGRFIAVGLSGVLINMLVMAAATGLFGIFYLLSAVLATGASTCWNFVLTDIWVFHGRNSRAGRATRFGLFASMNVSALFFRAPLIYLLTSMLLVHYLISNFVSLVALSILRYGISDSFIWKGGQELGATDGYCYDIHGIVTVKSDVRLPELAAFLCDMKIPQPMINVRIGRLLARPRFQQVAGTEQSAFSYHDGLGRLGFMIDVAIADRVEIIASPLLRFSPHVLYTNVVEPILRWSFVREGYALVHGACISFGSEAYLVTARTDTGKTTTILRILDRQRRASDECAFVSDDLTLLSPDRKVLTYPKPLTISRHTVAAVNTPALTSKQRLTLFVQSRLHSRGGRKVALQMSRSRLPMATINTIAQWLIPPPKYRVHQLIPRVKTTREARLAGVFVIERGGDGETLLDDARAIDILMRNSDDAYGFPPYPAIKQHLHGTGEHDLRPLEQSIVSQALTGLPASLLQSSTMDWSRRIPLMISRKERFRALPAFSLATPARPVTQASAD